MPLLACSCAGNGAIGMSRQPPNKQLEQPVIRRRGRAACASFHCAHAARWTCGHAAVQLRR